MVSARTKNSPGVDRRTLAELAVDARGKGQKKRAIELYRELLAEHPDDHEAHGKLAQLLADVGDLDAAAQSFRRGAEGYHHKGFTDRGLALLKQAAAHVPRDVDTWLRIAELNVIRERRSDAQKALRDGRAVFVAKADAATAARLLDAHLALAPNALDVVIDRAHVAKRLGQRGFGLLLLMDRLDRVDAAARKRLRHALFRLKPTPASWWRWLRNSPP